VKLRKCFKKRTRGGKNPKLVAKGKKLMEKKDPKKRVLARGGGGVAGEGDKSYLGLKKAFKREENAERGGQSGLKWIPLEKRGMNKRMALEKNRKEKLQKNRDSRKSTLKLGVDQGLEQGQISGVGGGKMTRKVKERMCRK